MRNKVKKVCFLLNILEDYETLNNKFKAIDFQAGSFSVAKKKQRRDFHKNNYEREFIEE